MKISIITTCFNCEKYIAETLESVLSQKGSFELEYIVVDGKSQDKSLPIILSYQERLKKGFYGKNPPCQMHVLSEKDNSMYEGIAKGFQLATGDIIAYINADDYYFPHAFEFIVSVFEKYPQISWLCGRQCTTDEKGNVTFNMLPFEYQRESILKGYYGRQLPFIQQETTFWRRSLMQDFDYNRFSSFRLAGDFYLWWCFAQKEELYIVNTFLAAARTRPGQLSEKIIQYREEMEKICNKESFSLKNLYYFWRQRHLWRKKDKHKLRHSDKIIFYTKKEGWHLSKKI